MPYCKNINRILFTCLEFIRPVTMETFNQSKVDYSGRIVTTAGWGSNQDDILTDYGTFNINIDHLLD